MSSADHSTVIEERGVALLVLCVTFPLTWIALRIILPDYVRPSSSESLTRVMYSTLIPGTDTSMSNSAFDSFNENADDYDDPALFTNNVLLEAGLEDLCRGGGSGICVHTDLRRKPSFNYTCHHVGPTKFEVNENVTSLLWVSG